MLRNKCDHNDVVYGKNVEDGNRFKILVVFGTRPEAIKMAPVVKELQRYPGNFSVTVCATAQHREMLDSVLNLFSIEPDYDLNIMQKNQSLFQIASSTLGKIQPVLEEVKPDIVLVQGDTSTAFIVSLAGFYLKIPVGHVEAGLRTNDKNNPFPEEINRRLISHVADLHFAPTETARNYLLAEGISPENIHVTGNTVIDALLMTVNDKFVMPPELKAVDFENSKIILVTAHRRENFGEPLRNICLALKDMAQHDDNLQIVYPVHLNPNVRRVVYDMLDDVENIFLTEPMDYEMFVNLMNKAYLILTDSGGIQEEAPSLGKPVLVLRNVTERPEAVEAGTAKVVGTEKENIIVATRELLDNKEEYDRMANIRNPYGDGTASKRIVKILGKWAVGRRNSFSKTKPSLHSVGTT